VAKIPPAPSDKWLEAFVASELFEPDFDAIPVPRAAPKRAPKRDVAPGDSTLERVRASFREAVPHATCPFDYLEELDRRLVIAGWPESTAWWRQALAKFYMAACIQFVLRVGRRGGKSSTICRMVVLEALMGSHQIPPGDTAVAAIISQNKEQAKDRIKTIDGILSALGIAHKSLTERIDLTEAEIAFVVYAATVGAVSGFTSIVIVCDEVSKWRDKNNNPVATEVLASVRPTMAVVKGAKIFLISSPMTRVDAHARAFDEGDSEFQCVAFAETWIARPELTKQMSRRLCSSEKEFLREYAAIPSEGTEDALFDSEVLTLRTRADDRLPREQGVEYVATMAPLLAHGAWALVIAAKRHDGPGGCTIVDFGECRGFIDPLLALYSVKERLSEYGLDSVFSHSDGAAHVEQAEGMGVHVRTMDATLPDLANEMLAGLGRGAFELPPNANVRGDLMALRKLDTASGFSVGMADVERYPSYAWPAMLALSEASRLSAPKPTMKADPVKALLRQLVQRNREQYDGFDDPS